MKRWYVEPLASDFFRLVRLPLRLSHACECEKPVPLPPLSCVPRGVTVVCHAPVRGHSDCCQCVCYEHFCHEHLLTDLCVDMCRPPHPDTPPFFFFFKPRRIIAGSHSKCCLTLEETAKVSSHGCATSHSHQQCVLGSATCSGPSPHLVSSSMFWILAIPVGVKWYLIVVLIYISLMINGAASFYVLICHLYNLPDEVSLPMFLLGCLSYY